MRKIKCKLCGEHWAARRGPICAFYSDHEKKHNLEQPRRQEGESVRDYLNRYFDWRDTYFEDSLPREVWLQDVE